MEASNTYTGGSRYAPTRPEAMRVNPRDPLPAPVPITPSQITNGASFPSEAASMDDNGLGRNNSRRRKAGDQSYVKSPRTAATLPTAPEVPSSPRGPPVSYQSPYSNGTALPIRNNSLKSFAARAGAIPDKVDPSLANSTVVDIMPALDRNSRPLRSSTSDSPRVNSATAQQPAHASYSTSTGEPSQARQIDSANTPRTQDSSRYRPANPKIDTNRSTPDTTVTSPAISSATRRTSTGAAERRAEWAPDRSPLQKLEVKLNDISKEEMRARVQEAEQQLKESKARKAARQSSAEITEVRRTASKRSSTNTREPNTRDAQVQTGNLDVSQSHFSNTDQSTSTRSVPQNGAEMEVRRNSQSSRPSPGFTQVVEGRPLNSTGLPSSQTKSQQNRRRSVDTTKLYRSEDRGVRFQTDRLDDGADEIVGHSDQTDISYDGSPRAAFETDAIRKGSVDGRNEASRLPQPTRKQDFTASGASREVPKEQKQLYMNRVEIPQGEDSAAAYGGAPDPMPGRITHRHDRGLKYEVPPQTASGIEASKRIGFGSRVEAPAHNAESFLHHASDLLHLGRTHHKGSMPQEPSTGTPRHLDEWRTGGVARLTLADLTSDDEAPAAKSAWWEAGRSEVPSQMRRSSATEKLKRGSVSLDGSYEDGNGRPNISHFPSHLPTVSPGVVQDGRACPSTVRARLYVCDKADEFPSARPRRRAWLRKPASITGLYRSSALQRAFTSAYSYSCPELADHDPSRISHICKPYLSKQLTRSMRAIRVRSPAVPTVFDPPLLLKCGPLLRYTGLKRDKVEQSDGRSTLVVDRETWRGSVMIVTVDSASSYDHPPTLRLFHQPIDLLPPPPQHLDGANGDGLPSEYIDPIAGLPKMSRNGGTVYVKPVEDLEEGVDVSRLEDDDGLFEVTRTANVPTAYGKADELLGRSPLPMVSRNRLNHRNGRRSGKFREVRGVRLHAERGVTFWRFSLEVELGEHQARIAYRINKAASIGFWVPGRGQTMNIMFHSCNGFSMSVNPADFSGPDPLWRDVLNSHQTKPFHVMIGGGDQIYNDAVMKQTTLFQEWLGIKNPHHKHEAPFTIEMRNELETFYLERYSMWFSQGLFGMANSQIAMVNMWDDHDIIDGFGSYPHHFMSTPVFSGLGAIAFKYYMLFQHQSVPDEQTAHEPSWLLGASRGPYINELSRSVFMFLGKHVAFLGLDCRTERMRVEILSEASYDLAFDRCDREIVKGETKHLIVLLGVPIAYPRLVWLENILTSRMMDPIKAAGRMGLLGGFLNQFDGGVEILDDLDDHWTAKNHKEERNWFLEKLQDLAAEKSVRITILGGDVHLAAIGQFYSNPKLKISKDQDPRYMPNVISSAIVNTPPPEVMGDILNKRNKVHHLDHHTDENMIPMFTHDVNGKPRNNKHLLPRRNWCSITEYLPGSTPPPTPPLYSPEVSEESLPRTPGRLQRTLSLTRGDSRPVKLLRRLSQRGPSSPIFSPDAYHDATPQTSPPLTSREGYFSTQSKPVVAGVNSSGDSRNVSAPLPTRPVSTFHRRPTNLSEKAAMKGGATNGNEINLQHGLDIKLNCEISQRDPAGTTFPYRLLVPALWYHEGVEGLMPKEKKSGFMQRLGSLRSPRGNAERQVVGNWGNDESETGSESESDAENLRYAPGKFTKRQVNSGQSRDQGTSQSQSQDVDPTMVSRTSSGAIRLQGGPVQLNSPRTAATDGPTPMGQAADLTPQRARSDSASNDKGTVFGSLPPTVQTNIKIPRRRQGSGFISQQETNVPQQRLEDKNDAHKSGKLFDNPSQRTGLQSVPIGQQRKGASRFDGDDGALDPDSPLMEEQDEAAPIRRRSKFDKSGSSKFFGTDGGSGNDGGYGGYGGVDEDDERNGNGRGGRYSAGGDVMGGYDGIEAYKDKSRGWKRLLGMGRRESQ